MIEYRTCPHCKENKNISEFYKKRGKEGNSTYCKICTTIQTKTRQQALKKKAIEYKGNKCQFCGYGKCQAALEFHHINPEEKDFEIGKYKLNSFKTIKKELDKCVLLCANCHREAHFTGEVMWNNANSDKVRNEITELDSYQKPKVNTKGNYPSDEELKKLVWKYPKVHLCKVYGVSDVALAKYLKVRGIDQPPKGYWAKINKEVKD